MEGDEVSFISRDKDNTSDEHNAKVDITVKKILDDSFKRVSDLLTEKDKELRNLSKALFQHDYLNAEEMDQIISGKKLDLTKTKKVRDWEKEEYLIKF